MQDFLQNGYAIVPNFIDRLSIKNIIREINRHITDENTHGTRNIARTIPAIASLANSLAIRDLLANIVKKKTQLVRSIYFNKTSNNNWFVPWHQDKVIAVKEKILTPEYTNWTVKQGTHHVQPPLEIMEKIITLRLHLDRTNINNGALKIIPQSHKMGFLNSEQIKQLTTTNIPIICNANPGDILIMSPLILHSSTKSKSNCDREVSSDNDRRIIHLEYALTQLPQHLTWAE